MSIKKHPFHFQRYTNSCVKRARFVYVKCKYAKFIYNACLIISSNEPVRYQSIFFSSNSNPKIKFMSRLITACPSAVPLIVINGIFPSACFKGRLSDFYFILLNKLVLKEGIHAFIYNF